MNLLSPLGGTFGADLPGNGFPVSEQRPENPTELDRISPREFSADVLKVNLPQALAGSVTIDSKAHIEGEAAGKIASEMLGSGLVLLPVGGTFENIYPKANKLLKSSLLGDPKIRVAHLDELVNVSEEHRFSTDLKRDFDFINKLEEQGQFIKIDPGKPAKEFHQKILADGGPRTIVLGVGPDPKTVHVAFMGEKLVDSRPALNETTELVEMGSGVSLHTNKAITIGKDIFDSVNLEKIIVVATGSKKAEAIRAAIEDSQNDQPHTGLGYLMKHHPQKLQLLLDTEAARLIRA